MSCHLDYLDASLSFPASLPDLGRPNGKEKEQAFLGQVIEFLQRPFSEQQR